jgi:membrane protein YqaA with SNARE-associated domain
MTNMEDDRKKRPGIVRRLYHWVLSWANTPYGSPALFVLAFAESSFFPIPPDVLQIALSAEKPKRAFWYASVSLVGSVLGALLAYYIGMFLWDVMQDFFYSYIISRENFATVAGDAAAKIDRSDPQYADTLAKTGWYHDYDFWAVFFGAWTPIPYKIIAIAAGVCSIAIPMFIFASIIGRGVRFFAVAALMFFFGPTIKGWIEKYFNLLAIVFAVLLIGGFVVIKVAL